MQTMIEIKDYISSDKEEDEIDNFKVKAAFMKERRGVVKLGPIPSINNKKFCMYALTRISALRVDKSDEIYVLNKTKHIYEKVSEAVLGAILMTLMDEYDPNIYSELPETKIFATLKRVVNSYKQLEVDKTHLLFSDGIFSLEDYSFDKKFSYEGVFIETQDYKYNKAAECPKFMKALNDIFNGDKQRIDLVQEFFGYTFWAVDSPSHSIMYWYSAGRSGKSLLSAILTALHGVANVSAVPIDKLDERFSLAALAEKRLNICPEVSQNRLLTSSSLKAITGSDVLEIEKKYQDSYSARLSCKILAMSNHYLRTADSSFGFWKRIITVPFDVTFLSESEIRACGGESEYVKLANASLSDELITDELSGIFNWAIEGLKRLRANNWVFSEPRRCAELKEQMKLLNKPVEVFVDRYITIGKASDWIYTSDLHQKFIEWAEINEIEIPELRLSRHFHKELRQVLNSRGISFEIKKRSSDRYVGILVSENYKNTIE